ncbi:MAG: class I SAM-dependent methyltransferase [Saprospiraceae bacterium]|nr:class I SAM-dependent methyltransferase [Saprospiraceae bacterium]
MNELELAPMVDWNAYAQQYDLLLAYNPYYQTTYKEIITKIQSWDIDAGSKLADLGAGTGNYSVELAKHFPQAQVLHIDSNKNMNAIAVKKAAGLSNLEIWNQPIEDTQFGDGSLQGLLCLNALYTFPNPTKVLEQMHKWLSPGSPVIFLDPGRVMNVFAWRMAIGWHLISQYGLAETLKIFKHAKVVGKQNAYIRLMQKNGKYWTHSHEEFCQAIEVAGFSIEQASICFRGDCDLVFARK